MLLKLNYYFLRYRRKKTFKLLFVMKLTAILLLTICLQVAATGFSQVTISKKNITLSHVFKELRKQSGYVFIYNNDMLPGEKRIDLDVKNASVKEVLEKCLKDVPLAYSIGSDRTVVISAFTKQGVFMPEEELKPILLRGILIDEKGNPIAGASIVIKGKKQGTASLFDGSFSIQVPDENTSIVITFVGYKTQELQSWKEQQKTIQMVPAMEEMKDVVVRTGMFDRNKQTFSGAVASFTGKELKQIGNMNVVQSLKTLDPSFIINVDNLQGSNPNQLPKIEVRGKTSLANSSIRDQFSSDPNQPLFILDGMETSLRQIIDLDINRIASVTLLKDASSTALYGSRAANGVVIVETIRPKPGDLNLSYTTDLRWEIPDLNDYNMMTAAENLEFQKLAGLYAHSASFSGISNDNLYNSRLVEVLSGVNSYWLKIPLRNSLTHGHSLRVSGGSSEFQYGVGLNYRKMNGVMKGSDRNTWGGSVDLNYRKKKLNISNQIYINGAKADESPYGSFADFVTINPYYRTKREDGSLNTDKYLESFLLNRTSFTPDTIRVRNPLYNATLNAENRNTSLSLQNTLNMIYNISDDWRLSGAFQIRSSSSKGINFVPSSNTMFDRLDVYRKGNYRESRNDQQSYQANMALTYKKILGRLHAITGNLRSELQEQNQSSSSYSATGFPEGVKPNPAFAYGFVPDTKPGYSTSKVRRTNTLASINYSYDQRYFMDATYRIDGSTSFGSENKYTPFWSIGIGWNLSNEDFLKNSSWLNMLRIRGNIGTTGNQALGSYASSSVYTFESNLSMFGQGLYLSQLGNPFLEWQKTRATSIGIDAALFNNRLSATINAYEKLTQPLITQASQPASSGVPTYPLNVGGLRTRGLEAIIRYSPVHKPQKDIIWTLGYTGSLFKSKYEGFSNILKNLNDEAQRLSSLERYYDGYSPDEVWAVPSLGIDPATGKEVFRKKNGEKTFIYDPTDIRPMGEGRPKIEGVVSSNLNYKGFLFGINLRYSIGKYIFNSALFDKVENIQFSDLRYNQDKRALELRWKKIGDQAQFKGISISENTPISSRFVEKENFLSGESINAGYEFRSAKHRWVRTLKLQTVRLNAYMNEIFRYSNIRSERGIYYPFSNSISFSANIFF